MVKIASKDFNMDMDKYIKDRRSRDSSDNSSSIGEKLSEIRDNIGDWKLFSLFQKSESEVVPLEDVDDDDDEDYSDEESEIEAIDELEDELEERRENILKRFFRKLRFSSRKKVAEEEFDDYDDENYDDEDEIEDIREVIKITHKWLERLPPEEIERFKRSDDFVKYKAVLKKLDMIK